MELAEELDALGHRDVVVALGPGLDGGQEQGLVPLVASPGVGPLDLARRVRAVRRLLAGAPVDVVLAHGGWAAQVAALAAPRTGPVLVWQRILGFPPSLWRTGRRQWWRQVASRFDACVALTDALGDEVRRLGFRGPVWIIPNSRRTERFEGLDRGAAATALRAEVGVAEGVPLLGFVGHLVEQKRPERAVEVLAGVRDEGRAAHLVVAGGGPLEPMLEDVVARRGLQGSVSLLGHRDDVERILAGVDLLLLTSEAEGIPGVAIEALMAGCPVVTVPVGSVAEVVEDGVTGVVLPSSDPGAMAAAVRSLLDDEGARARMSEAARRRTDRFSAATTAREYEARLLGLAAVGRRARSARTPR